VIRLQRSSSTLARAQADAVAILIPQAGRRGPVVPGGTKLEKALDAVCRADGFRGKKGEVLLFHAPEGFPSRRYLVAGMGPAADLDGEAIRHAASAAARKAGGVGARKLGLRLPELEGLEPGAIAQAVAEGVQLGCFQFDRYLTDPSKTPRSKLNRVEVFSDAEARVIREALRRGDHVAGAANFARSLVNEPAGEITPMRMAAIARDESKKVGLECKVLRLPELRRRGMGGMIGVGQGSAHEPCLIHLRYKPSGKARKKVALIGKGITFDSGGLSLKPPAGMESMKADKAGSVVVLAVLRALPELGLPVQVDGIMAMAENMPSGTAQKPGDVLRMMSGKTVEVTNTDAEGRLVLADALAYAAELGPDQMIDLATLTGAVVVALGPLAAGVMGNREELTDAILEAARGAGEKMWPLPLYPEYREMLESPIADMKNTGLRWGGALTAGLFLEAFVDKGMPWAHLDIAGPAFLEKDHAYLRRGATGVGVRTILRHLESLT
jgi:leucyl aminopeptidase